MSRGGALPGEIEHVLRDVLRGEPVGADQLVQSRERGRELRARDDLGAPYGDEGTAPAGVRAVIEAQALRQAQRVQIRLPARGAVRARGRPEYLLEALARQEHLALGPPGVGRGRTVLPFHVVPGVNSAFESRVPCDPGRD